MEHADEPNRLTRLDAEGDDVLNLEVDRLPDFDAVAQPVLLHLEGRPLDAEHLADEDDGPARALYESAGFTNRGSRPDGPLLFFYEREL